jgi:hypothetical protein
MHRFFLGACLLLILTGCKGDAQYSSGGAPLHISNAPTARFAVIGDYGIANPGSRAVSELVKSWRPDFIITTGDNNYFEGEASTIDMNVGLYYHEFISPYHGRFGEGADTNRFFPSLGNHDWRQKGARPYIDYFTLPGNERYYSFIWGPVQFFALDSDLREPDGATEGSRQAQWLREQLALSEQPFRFLYMHHSPYSSGPRGSTIYVQWPFDKWGADAVFSGHDHIYERFVRDKVLYLVIGLGGNGAYDFYSTIDGSRFRYNGNYGAILVEVDESSAKFMFHNIKGELLDSHTMSK